METLAEKAQRLGMKPAGKPVDTSTAPQGETLAQKAQRLGMKPATPQDTSATPFGTSFLGKVGNTLSNIGAGAGAEIGKAGLGLGELTLKGLGKIGVPTEGAVKGIQDIKQKVYEDPFKNIMDTTSGKVGQAVGIGAEFMVPNTAILKGQKIATGLANLIPATSKTMRVVQGTAGVLGRAVPEYLGGAGVELARTGGDVESAKTAGLFQGGASVALGGLGAAYRGVKNADITGGVLKEAKDTKIQKMIGNEVDNLLKQTRSIEGKSKLNIEKKNIPLKEIISDIPVFKGIKVENGTIKPDEAINVIDNRIDTLMEAKRKMLPEIDAITQKTPKEVLRQRALAEIKGKTLPLDESTRIKAINEQIDALPDELTVSQIDDIRAKARQSARDAKGLYKSDSEYVAIEKAARDTVFDITDNLPFDTNGEFKNINNYVKDMLGTRKFLDETLRGQVMKGRRLGNYFARGIGAIAGSQGGVITAIMGAEAGGAIQKILVNNNLGSSFKMQLIKNITDNPTVIQEAQNMLQKVKGYNPLMTPALPAGAMRMGPKVTESGVDVAGTEAMNKYYAEQARQNTLRLPAGNPSDVAIPMGAPKSAPSSIQILPAQKGPVGVDPKTGRFIKTYTSQSATPNISLQNTANNITAKAPKDSISPIVTPLGKAGKMTGVNKQAGFISQSTKKIEEPLAAETKKYKSAE